MPFAAPTQMDDPNDPNKKSSGSGVNISGSSASFASGIPGQESAPGSSDSKQNSGQYSNIQSYLDANKSQGDQMGQKIAGNVANEGQDATQKINSFQTQAPKVDSYDPNSVINNINKATDADKAQYNQFKQTGGYTGPKSLGEVQGYNDTSKAAGQASQDAKFAGNESGQQQLLKQTYARPNYSAGENRLDQALLQGSDGSRSALEGISKKYSGLDQMFGGAQKQVGDAVNQANTQAQANQAAFNPAETQARQGLINPIQARADQMNRDNTNLIDRYTNEATSDKFSEDTLKNLGLTAGQNIYDLNLGNYLNKDRSQASLNNAATGDERNKYSALSALFGDSTMNQITKDGKQLNPVSFNQDQFAKDLASKKSEYDTAYAGQRGSVLNNKYLSNPNAAGGYSAYIPGALTDRRDLSNATAEELEKYWLPQVFNPAAAQYGNVYSGTRDAIARSLQEWKDKYQPNRTIGKG